MAFGPQEAIDNAAILSSGIAGAEALGMIDLPPFLKLLTYALVATSIISHILKSDHGAPHKNSRGEDAFIYSRERHSLEGLIVFPDKNNNQRDIQTGNIGGDEYDGPRDDE